jgi:hypothetical protein
VQPRFVQTIPNSTGSKIQNLAVTAYVDNQDGNGPQLATLFLQATAVYAVDANGNLLDPDENLLTSDWKRQMLDELRAIRIGVQMQVENRRDMVDSDQSLIDQAQSLREEREDQLDGPQAQGVGGSPTI